MSKTPKAIRRENKKQKLWEKRRKKLFKKPKVKAIQNIYCGVDWGSGPDTSVVVVSRVNGSTIEFQEIITDDQLEQSVGRADRKNKEHPPVVVRSYLEKIMRDDLKGDSNE